METIIFTKTDIAKYPFLSKIGQYVKDIDLDIADLRDNEVLAHAEKRAIEAIESVRITRDLRPIKADIEISSYPVALLLVAATENSFIKRRYALAEAKQASADLAGEPKEKILKIAENFGWKLTRQSKHIRELPLDFILNFGDYLRNTTHLRDKKWKLINRIMKNGNVYLNQSDVVRLLEEEIRKNVEKRLELAKTSKYPSQIVEIAEKIKKLAATKIGTAEMEGIPQVVTQSAFPPCIKALYEAASKGRHLSHVGRFTLTSFLVNIGLPSDKVSELFRSFSDYNERLTRYQIEHIAGERGSGTRYTPPQCATLQTHGVCVNSDDLCSGVRHPLSYYKRKQRSLTK